MIIRAKNSGGAQAKITNRTTKSLKDPVYLLRENTGTALLLEKQKQETNRTQRNRQHNGYFPILQILY